MVCLFCLFVSLVSKTWKKTKNINKKWATMIEGVVSFLEFLDQRRVFQQKHSKYHMLMKLAKLIGY